MFRRHAAACRDPENADRDNEILIFDEPTAVLTPQEIKELMQIMKGLTAEGKSILFITHKLNEIMEVADRCTVLRKGKCIGTVNVADTTVEELSRMMVGREVHLVIDKKEAVPGKTVLRAENITVPSRLHKNNAVKDISFDVRAGEIVCLAGLSEWNGKSEARSRALPRMTGIENMSAQIEFEGSDITKANIRTRSKYGISQFRRPAQVRAYPRLFAGRNLVPSEILGTGIPEPRLYPQGKGPEIREKLIAPIRCAVRAGRVRLSEQSEATTEGPRLAERSKDPNSDCDSADKGLDIGDDRVHSFPADRAAGFPANRSPRFA
jgi:simple sugar transport system ATP-binding protein